jgi:hypothetical protein
MTNVRPSGSQNRRRQLKNITCALIAAAGMTISMPASSATIDLGVLDSTVQTFSRSYFRSGNDTGSPLGAYSEIYTFKLLSLSDLVGDLTRINTGRTLLSAALSLTGGGLANPLEDATLGGFTFSNLAAGDYALEVHGTFAGISGTSSFTGHISARELRLPGSAPEPGVWLTMVFGFGTLGGVARGRRYRASLAE